MAKFVLSAFADEAGDSLAEQIDALKANGIGYIEPRNIDGKGIIKLTKEELEHVRSELDKNGIKVGSLGSPIGKYPIEEPFENHLEDFKKALDACDILGTKKMRMFSFFIPEKKYEEYRDEVLRRLNVMAKIANERAVQLCHENESKIYGEYPEQVADLMNNVDGLYGIFDAANYRMGGANVMNGIGATLKRFAYMHVKDAIFGTKTIVPAGEGEGKVGDVIDVINGFTDEEVYLTVEPHLHQFTAYKDIDERELKGKYQFKNNRESFDFAVNALKKLLKEHGYERNGNNEWIK